MLKWRNSWFLALVLVIHTFSYAAISPQVPDPEMTSGDLCDESDEDFLEYRYEEQIPYCDRDVSAKTKRLIYERYGVKESDRTDYTIDHFIPLAAGGSNDEKNLWPEHKKIKATRKNLEYRIYLDLVAGRTTQEQAIQKIIEAKTNPPQNIESNFIVIKNYR